LINNKKIPLTITIFKNNNYGTVQEALNIMHKDYKSSKISEVSEINYDILPNCHNFYNLHDYYVYVNKYPISKNIRFIILHIKETDFRNSFAYEIDITNKEYINALKKDDFIRIKNLPQVNKLDLS